MRYLIINFYSPGNAGDYAILEATVNLLREADDLADISVCVSDKYESVSLSVKIDVDKWVRGWSYVFAAHDPAQVVLDLLKAYHDADIILSLGGGYFFVHDLRPVSIFSTLSLVAGLLARKPVICLPQSFGPFKYKYQAWIAAKLLAHTQIVMTRERESFDVLTGYIGEENVLLVPDTAFVYSQRSPAKQILDSKRHRYNDALRDQPSKRISIGITAVDWSVVDGEMISQANYEQSVADLIVYICRKYNAQVTLFVQCKSQRRIFEDDLAVTRRVVNLVEREDVSLVSLLTIENDLIAPIEYIKAYSQMDFFVATRLHSAIFAFCGGVPTMTIGYQHKSTGIMDMMGLTQYSCRLGEVSSEKLINMLESAWIQRSSLQSMISINVRKLGTVTAETISEVLSRYIKV
jgi:colanic acid/amylovoran biosynthesis protein